MGYGFGQGCGYCEGGYGTVTTTARPMAIETTYEAPTLEPELELEIVKENEKLPEVFPLFPVKMPTTKKPEKPQA